MSLQSILAGRAFRAPRRGFNFKLALALLLGGCMFAARPRLAAAKEPAKPVGAAEQKVDLAAVVKRTLSQNVDYRPGDLISQNEIEPIVDELLNLGVRPADNEELYDAILTANDHLVVLFQAPGSRAFIREAAKTPGAYDALERLGWTAAGREMLDQLIANPDGQKMFQTLMTPAGSAKFQELVKNDPRGRNFGLPTGRVHTADDFIQRLQSKAFLQPGQTNPRDAKK
ncbi:MAG TPA: hypothetical protein VFE24_02335 [Pirellulales bacterium]|jgi:hypothetical protein|nr:hypothetical protein [Pirellulales bacterium]